jgi:UDP-N-acetyl-D-glucosamine dehydrogenase
MMSIMNLTIKEKLINKLNKKEAVIGIVGMGYVGLPLVLMYVKAGYSVIGIDIDPVKVDSLNSGRSYIGHIPNELINQAKRLGFRATMDFSEVGNVDVVIICVPTPLGKHREPDLSFIESTMDSVIPFLRKGQVISLESTTYPGTTEEVLLPLLKKTGLETGESVFLVYSPEREDPGNPDFNTQNVPKICSGYSDNCLEVGLALYQNVVDRVVPVSSPKVAEMTKLLENIYRAVNIGLVNELKIVADRMDIDIHEVISAAATKPFGFTPFYPGPGLGGHCIPIDPFYLTWKAQEFGLHTRFIELAGEVNTNMPLWVIGKIIDALNSMGKSLKGSRVLVLGIAYKKNVDDTRESSAVELMKLLVEKGALVQYSDPHLLVFPNLRKHQFDLKSTDLTADTIGSFDCLLLATDHDAFDYKLFKQHAKLIVDTRGVYKESADNIIRA